MFHSNKIISFFIFCLILISFSAHGGVIKKVKGQKVLISIDGHERIKRGQTIKIKTSNGKVITTVVSKVGKKSVLVIAPKNAKLNVGDKTVSQSTGKKTQKVADKKTSKKAEPAKKSKSGKPKNWFLEPYFGKTLGSVEATFDYTAGIIGSGTIEGATSGFEFGSTGGYKLNDFLLGVKFYYQIGTLADVTLKTQLTNSSSEQTISDSEYVKNGLGPMFGYCFGEHFRIWFSYLITTLDDTASNGDKTIYSGSSIELGGGWKLDNNFSINLNVGKTTYSSEDTKPYPFSTTTSGVTTESKGYGETYFVLNVSYFWPVF
jgi:hypothetical protein